MIAFLFPGQGSQQVGMGKALTDAFPEARATFDEADAAFGAGSVGTDSVQPASLTTLCFDGPEDQLRLTEYTQPAILTVSIAAARVLASRGFQPDFVAGHSLGEYSANVVAGTFAFSDAVAVVRRRGRYMQEAVPVGQGAMAAILGLDATAVRLACEDAAQGEVVAPANINSHDQVVIAGAAAAVERAGVLAKERGAKRVMPLPVSAPFHCALMQPAEERLAPELLSLAVQDPGVPVVANVDAQLKRDGGAAIDALIRQVSSPVRWEEIVERLASEGVTTYVEVGVGRVLSGLVRKTRRDAKALAFGAPEDLSAVEQALGSLA
jgi:[acyl-carrier-protein] S-malonyltransferase